MDFRRPKGLKTANDRKREHDAIKTMEYVGRIDQDTGVNVTVMIWSQGLSVEDIGFDLDVLEEAEYGENLVDWGESEGDEYE